MCVQSGTFEHNLHINLYKYAQIYSCGQNEIHILASRMCIYAGIALSINAIMLGIIGLFSPKFWQKNPTWIHMPVCKMPSYLKFFQWPYHLVHSRQSDRVHRVLIEGLPKPSYSPYQCCVTTPPFFLWVISSDVTVLRSNSQSLGLSIVILVAKWHHYCWCPPQDNTRDLSGGWGGG